MQSGRGAHLHRSEAQAEAVFYGPHHLAVPRLWSPTYKLKLFWYLENKKIQESLESGQTDQGVEADVEVGEPGLLERRQLPRQGQSVGGHGHRLWDSVGQGVRRQRTA